VGNILKGLSTVPNFTSYATFYCGTLKSFSSVPISTALTTFLSSLSSSGSLNAKGLASVYSLRRWSKHNCQIRIYYFCPL